MISEWKNQKLPMVDVELSIQGETLGIQTHKLTLYKYVPILDFKKMVLLYTNNLPFFLEFNLSNISNSLNDLIKQAKGALLQIYLDLEIFELKLKGPRENELYSIPKVKATHKVSELMSKLESKIY